MSFEPVIDPAIWRLRPDYVALSLVVRDGAQRASDEASDGAAGGGRTTGMRAADAWAEAHLRVLARGLSRVRRQAAAYAMLRRGAAPAGRDRADGQPRWSTPTTR